MTEELKPCPWCGEIPEIHYCLNAFGMIEKHSISCKNHPVLFSRNTKDEAIAAWNHRHESGELPEWLVIELNLLKENNPFSEKYDGEFNAGFEEGIDKVLSLRKPEEKE